MKRNLVLALLMAFLLAGCLGKQLPFQAVTPTEGKAVVYTYRPDSLLNRASTAILEVGGEEIGYLSSGFYIPTVVDPGETTVVIKVNQWPYTEYDSVHIADIKAGETKYLKVEPTLGSFNMNLVDESVGEKEITETKLFVND